MLKTAQDGTSSASATDGNAVQSQAGAGTRRDERAGLEGQLVDQLAQSQSGANGGNGMPASLYASTIEGALDRYVHHPHQSSEEIRGNVRAPKGSDEAMQGGAEGGLAPRYYSAL